MAQEDLRLLLEMGRDDDGGNVLLHGREGLDHAAAHVEVELADGQQHAVAGPRAARHDGDLEAVFLVSAVGDGLVIAAMLALGEPVGAEGHLGQRLLRQGASAQAGRKRSRDPGVQLHRHSPSAGRANGLQSEAQLLRGSVMLGKVSCQPR